MYCIYIISFKSTPKIYIGLTSCFEKRKYNHLSCKTSYPISRAIKKYGKDDTIFSILFENLSKEDACKKEIECIKNYKSLTTQNGYNVSLGGQTGACLTGEARINWINKIKKTCQSFEYREQQRNRVLKNNHWKGRKVPKEETERINTTKQLKRAKMKPVTMDNSFTFFSISEASMYCLGDSSGSGNIYKCCKGNLKSAYKHTWEFAKNNTKY
jgi:predicted GIY-YIG superfamily endonuclease